MERWARRPGAFGYRAPGPRGIIEGMDVQLRPGTGRRVELVRGQTLRVIDVEGAQVADLMAVCAADPAERLSSGRTFDYNRSLFLSTGGVLYSNRSRPLFTIVADTAGRHDFLFAACSQAMFALQDGATEPHANCLANLAACYRPHELDEDGMPTPFNVFMRVDVDPCTGALTIRAPSSQAGDHVDLRAEQDLVVAVTACAAEHTNQGRLKPVGLRVFEAGVDPGLTRPR